MGTAFDTRSTKHTLSAGWGLLLLLTTLGCNDSETIGYVSGKVTLDGKPLPNAFLEFQPDEGTQSLGMTDENGNYSLQLTANESGAVIGKHQVSIYTSWIDTADDGTKTTRPELVPEKYNSASTLTKEVVPGRQTIDFDLKSE